MTKAEARYFTIPNVISFVRLSLVPVFLWAFAKGSYLSSLWIFSIAMLSDWLDGFLARFLNQRSALGAFIDPVADKLMVISALVGLALSKQLPWWLVATLVGRDGAMALGALRVRRRGLSLPQAPSRFGKYATFFMTLTVVLSFWGLIAGASMWLLPFVHAVAFLAGLFVILSTVQYVHRFGNLWNGPPI